MVMTYNVSVLGAGAEITYSELNALVLNPGDIVLFKSGETFRGSFTAKAGVTYGRFGTGAKPVLSGLSPSLTKWTKEGNGIYSVPLDVPKLNIVTVNGVVKPMGRYPRNGIITYTGFTGTPPKTLNTSLSVNFTGGEIAIRKLAWVWDRHTIVGQTIGSVTFSVGTVSAGNSYYNPFPGNGFFVQNHINTLRVFGNHQPILGDWYYNTVAKKLFVYFGSTDPASIDVKAATVNSITSVFGKSNITFNNIRFEGVNQNLITSEITTANKYQSCEFFGAGWNGISGDNFGSGGENNYNEFTDCTFDYCLNEAVRYSYNCNNNIFTGNKLTNISPFSGATFPADYGGNGITCIGDRNYIEHNHISHIGYNGIAWGGNGNIINENTIESCCRIKDDGGNIYSYNSDRAVKSGNIIRNNILIGSNGALLGKEGYKDAFGMAACLYFDDGCNGITVSGNVFTDSTYAGMYVHNSFNITRLNNTYHNNARQIYLQQNQAAGIRDVKGTGEKYICQTLSQVAVDILSTVLEPAIHLLFGESDHNYYDGSIRVYNNGTTKNLTLTEWKTVYRLDVNSFG